MKLVKGINYMVTGGGGQDGGGVGGHARPLQQTQQKKAHLQNK